MVLQAPGLYRLPLNLPAPAGFFLNRRYLLRGDSVIVRVGKGIDDLIIQDKYRHGERYKIQLYAAIAMGWLQQFIAPFAVIKILACISWHIFSLYMPTQWTCDC